MNVNFVIACSAHSELNRFNTFLTVLLSVVACFEQISIVTNRLLLLKVYRKQLSEEISFLV